MHPTNSSFVDCEYFGGNFKHKNQGLAVSFFLYFSQRTFLFYFKASINMANVPFIFITLAKFKLVKVKNKGD